ncbi:hypothetical protein TELCIR_04566 [Teladorsagia circumcincta]|uniref:Uncharacterized protein n=1 Tax=Teladorsagia circumcincta TaxID=45464 RepID=A0A2G9UT90_TELCI|nr:hypothetical protein TELCIR_04566 [Teladorsagia circumcincta]
MGNSLGSDLSGGRFLYANEYPTSEETQKRLVREPPLIKRGLDPFSIPSVIKEPPLKRGDKRDSYVYPSTNSQLSDRIPLREPPLKRGESLDEAVYVLLPEREESDYDGNLPGKFARFQWAYGPPIAIRVSRSCLAANAGPINEGCLQF